MKTQRTISIDHDIHQTLKENPQINVSAVVNRFLRDYIDANHLKERKKE